MFTNLDACWLTQLAESLPHQQAATQARLRSIAANIQRMDEANAALTRNQSFDEGYAKAKREMLSRSNILTNPEGESEAGAALLDGVTVTKVPYGKRALDDRPDRFNAPRRAAKPKPKLELDLSFFEEI